MLVASVWNILVKRKAITLLHSRDQVVYSTNVWGCSPVARFCDFVGKNGDEGEGEKDQKLHCREELFK